MNISYFILLIFSHYLIGWGILRIIGFKNITTSLVFTLLSFMIGEGLSSLIPVIMEVISLPITHSSLAITIIIFSAVPLVFWLMSLRNTSLDVVARGYWKKLRLYDIVFLCVLFFLIYVAMFKCAYYPPVPRDMLSGPEAIAEYTIREHHINNSYFSVDLTSTDNYQKPPYLVGMQIIYKSYVQPFGQVWLVPLYISFFLLFYTLARKVVHPIFAGIATLLIIANPEFYAYLVMVLFDVSNVIYLFIGFYHLYVFFQNNDKKYLWLSSIGFALATLARPETVFLVVFICLSYCIWQIIRVRKGFIKPVLIFGLILFGPVLLMDVFTMEIFVKRFLPSDLSIGGKLNNHLSDLSPFFQRLSDIINLLMFTDKTNPKVTYLSSQLYTETFDIMLLFIILELGFSVFTRKISRQAVIWFMFIFLVFILLGFVGYLIPWADLSNNSKRGLFKMLPLIFFFVILTRPIQFLSNRIIQWESK